MKLCDLCRAQVMAWVLSEKSRYEDLMVSLGRGDDPGVCLRGDR